MLQFRAPCVYWGKLLKIRNLRLNLLSQISNMPQPILKVINYFNSIRQILNN